MLPCLIFEDDHLLLVNKPAGMNTHSPGQFAGEGIYDWLRHREPRWARLAIIHRLDKETSGVIVFGKSTVANRSLTAQFTSRLVRKKYLLLTDSPMKRDELIVKSKIVRAGERYVSGAQGEPAETRFKQVAAEPLGAPASRRQAARLAGETPALPGAAGNYHVIEVEPLTGRTHQIRVHAAEAGIPILGDALYGGTAFHRVCLHAAEITFKHPLTDESLTFRAPADFDADTRPALRSALLDADETNAFRLIHGASDGCLGWYVDRLGDYLLSQSEAPLTKEQQKRLHAIGTPSTSSARTAAAHRADPGLGAPIQGIYHKILSRHIRGASATDASPQLVSGEAAPDRFTVLENGIQFELSFTEGYSVGLFLDQRDNRRRFLTGHIAAEFPLLNTQHATRNTQHDVLNVFAYTCGFSVCAAKGGAKTTSLDLSKKYLEWGRLNFARNGLDPAEHDFIYGDAFDWLRRLAKKGRAFDAILLDPPTFSQSKERGVFRVEKNYGELVSAALPLLRPAGILLASTNAAEWPPEKFLTIVENSVRASKRKILQQHYAPQPPDFPISRGEPAYLKTAWLRVS